MKKNLLAIAMTMATVLNFSSIVRAQAPWTKTGNNIYPTTLGDYVGIGTTTPATNLVVFNANNPATNLQYSNTAGIFQMGLNTTAGHFTPIATVGDATLVNRLNSGSGDLLLVNSIPAPSAGNGAIRFVTSITGTANETEKMSIQSNGQVLIGTSCALPTGTGALLGVNGTIYAKSLKVDLTNAGCFPDYVFEKDYKLLSLSEVEAYINKNKHLPEVPSAMEVEKNGTNLADMDAVLLKKIEELTLYMIKMKKENSVLKKEIEVIKNN